MEYRGVALISGGSYVRTLLRFVRFDPAVFSMKVLTADQVGKGRAFYVRDVIERSKAVLLINGSYFGENGRPLGFLVSNGRTINKRVATNWLYSGLFYVREGRPHLVDRRDYPRGLKVEQALQAGPYLIEGGRPVRGIRHRHASYFRSGIGLTEGGKAFVFITDTDHHGVSWYELQQVLSLEGLHCARAMNLDGGGSAQMAWISRGRREVVDGTSRIPVAIGFFRR